MARWRSGAIWFGVAVETILVFSTLLLPVVGAAAVGAAAGFVAGMLAGGGTRPGARHGVAVGVAGAVLVLLAGAVTVLTIGLDVAVLTPVRSWPGMGVAGGYPLVVAGALALVAVAGLAGALGGQVRGEREFPGRLENEPAERR